MLIGNITHLILENQVQEFKVEWRLIPGYGGAYCAGTNGSVWSRYVNVGWGKWIIGTDSDWREVSFFPSKGNTGGYRRVSLWFDGVGKTILVHQLIADLFIGPCPHGLECCHEDGDCQNNDVVNIRYDTHESNMADKVKHGTNTSGELNPMACLTQAEVDEIREEYATEKYSQTQLGRKYGVVGGTVRKIVRNERWVDRDFKGIVLERGHLMSGEDNSNSRLTWDKIDLIREEYATGEHTLRQIAKRYGVCFSNIHRIVTYQSWVR